jgi:hypothetical protein
VNRVAARAHPSFKQQQLGRLAGTVDTLNCDQASGIGMRGFEERLRRGLGEWRLRDVERRRYVPVPGGWARF